ncbi:hypothetical protein AK88_03470 [Plasmodium fragile]|uniref:TRIP4/RQT4 C2HC5-type zinc finger domain-containing protein n=1 Tax=Plasmodium fragile TaxID=5857 RepID=A0A0D9QIG6_PLAFR|nr:uncharacterized protein AK88_03470 [Plasmodium fragile]KJP86860.1 hypothetical protein AK88_03470 [Plasmodium fragile]
MDEKDKYANHIRRKIIKFFNLKNEELDPSYIKSILNCKSYDLYGSIYLLNESFYENGRNEKVSLSAVKKFTLDLVEDKKKFISSGEDDSVVGGATQGGLSSYGQTTNHGAIASDGLPKNVVKGKTINSYFEEVFKREDVQPSQDKNGKVLPNRGGPGKVKKVGQMEADQNKYPPRRSTNDTASRATTHDTTRGAGENPLDAAVRLANETGTGKEPKKVNKEKNSKVGGHSPNVDKPNGVTPQKQESQKGKGKETKGKEAQGRTATKLQSMEHAHKDDHTQLADDQTKSKMNSKGKAENNYFEFFNMKENSYSLKTVINFIENEEAKGDEQNEYEKEEQKKEKKKKKNTHICTCNGSNHQIYSNCLICGKIYCAKIKYRQCLCCGNPLYDSSLINKLFTPTEEDGENSHKKMLATMKNSNPFLYKHYFDPSNAFLKKAFNLRDKMLRNSANEEHTKIIDDSIDWFEDDIKKEFDNPDVHFSNYDDEIKNEIIDKYYEIFGKKCGDINIDIDLVSMKITENKDHAKIKEFNDYLNERENEYRNEMALKKANDINASNVHNYLANKERKNLNYIKDLRKLFFRDTSTNAVAADTVAPSTEQQKKTIVQIRKASKKYKCHVLGESDEEYEHVE